MQQLTALRQSQPNSKFQFIKPGTFRRRGFAQPTPISAIYAISITYNSLDYSSTEVRDLSPALQMVDGKEPPHMYDAERLCLYLSEAAEWDGSDFIAHTILPWTSLWLYFYELWLITGQWLGGGKHPSPQEKKEAAKNLHRPKEPY
jgi:hypothetical protein